MDCWRVTAARGRRQFSIVIAATSSEEAASRTRTILEDDSVPRQRMPGYGIDGPAVVVIRSVEWLHSLVANRHDQWNPELVSSLLPPQDGRSAEPWPRTVLRRSLLDVMLNPDD
jgi:hypothetical protein